MNEPTVPDVKEEEKDLASEIADLILANRHITGIVRDENWHNPKENP
jgi:hypothetical protein